VEELQAGVRGMRWAILHREAVATVLLAAVSQARVGASPGGRVTGEEVVRLQHEFGLIGCPKQLRRRHVVVAMGRLLEQGCDLDDIRRVVSGSDSAWRRCQEWFRESRGMTVGDYLAERFMDSLREQAVERVEEAEQAAHVGTGGWQLLRDLARGRTRSQMSQLRVVGPDVGDPFADAAYLLLREKWAKPPTGPIMEVTTHG
jgi:hypothetical protein